VRTFPRVVSAQRCLFSVVSVVIFNDQGVVFAAAWLLYPIFVELGIAALSPRRLKPYGVMSASKVPIVYSKAYNITAFGLENLHPFDSQKYGRGECLLRVVLPCGAFPPFRLVSLQ
jgi:hypothetical protein